jgi:polyphosphate kinase
VLPEHHDFIRQYFLDEVFPYLQPVPVCKEVKSFLADNRIYLAVRLIRDDGYHYFVIKLPRINEVPRFVELPKIGKNYYLMYLDDVIMANLGLVFPGYKLDSVYSIKISRDADIMLKETDSKDKLVADIKQKVKKRKIGAVCRFVYDRSMPAEFLDYLTDAFNIDKNEIVLGERHLNLEDLSKLPNPSDEKLTVQRFETMKLRCLSGRQTVFGYVASHDLLLYYPYFSFDHFLSFLIEAAHDPYTEEIMLTQYRVAENSAVIDKLIEASNNGKKVTVFVELKARFDEVNNIETSERMRNAGINIVFSLPKLKVHAKVALVKRHKHDVLGRPLCDYAYIGTGNFNEVTAKTYCDIGLFTSDSSIAGELYQLFHFLSGGVRPAFKHLLVAQFNLVDEITALIRHEIALADAGKDGRMVIKLNSLQDPYMIDLLYEASQHGVKIDLIIRGICCLVPGMPYSRNIAVTRIIDTYLEHSRVWYFGNDGDSKIYLGSPDWMKRNLYRRIEVVTPVNDAALKKELLDMLHYQLSDNQKACWIDGNLNNIFKKNFYAVPMRAQYDFYNYLKEKKATYST